MEIKKYEYIDVMRGIAILLVVVTHTTQAFALHESLLRDLFEMSQVGVQLFFVASALTLYLSMSSRGLSKREVPRFYLRRFFRIAPLYYMGIVLYFLLAQHRGVITGLHREGYNFVNIAANVLLVHDLYPPSTNTVVPGGWSIGCEMLFYAIFPLIFLCIRTKRAALLFIVVSLLVNVLMQFGIRFLFKEPLALENNSFRYFLIPNQLPVFGCGILLYFAVREPRLKAKSSIDLLLSSCLLILAFRVWHSPIRLSFALIPTITALAFFYLGKYLSQANLNHIAAAVIASMGRKSFSIYILHILFAYGVVPKVVGALDQKGTISLYLWIPLMIVFVTAFSYIAALFTSRYIEDAGIKLGKKVIAAVL